jgi:(2R)-3-sulfolactate dehydrogenase (NADP+)
MAIITTSALHDLLVRALETAGFSTDNAEALARQTVLSEELGQQSVGVAHVFDYVDGLAEGRIDGNAVPTISNPAPTMIFVDGNGGLPQLGFDLTCDDLTANARKLGLCVFLQKNTTLCGSLGTFAMRVAEAGLVCFAATNGPPLLAGSGGTKPVFCTNPMAFSAPQASGPPLLIDQSSSATAFVNIRAAAERGDTIPAGWAIDREGQPTTDPKAALEGTMLAFGGARGANIALMVDVLAGGLTGANWSLDAPSFFQGDQSPGTGLFVLAIDPTPVDAGFSARMAAQIERLDQDYGVHIPGMSKAKTRDSAATEGVDIDDKFLARLQAMVG